MKNKPLKRESDLDEASLRYFISLPVKEKLNYLEQLNSFLQTVMPEKSKRIWERLKEAGF